jgi:microcystin-dependent protein
MTRPTLVNGSLWSDALANSAGFPVLDGSDEYGHGPKVINDWLDDAPDQIKSVFYSFYNRVKVSTATGLSVSYTGASILLSNGTIVPLAPGTLALADNSTLFIYINNIGAVTASATLPSECVPLAKATTASGAITQLVDLRDKVLEQIGVSALPPASSPYLPGDIKTTFRSSLEAGFLFCDGASYLKSDYPDLYAVLGDTYKLAGDASNSFRVPNLANRVLAGAASGRPIGTTYGNSTVTLNVSQMPLHSHSVNDAGHSHGVNDPTHNHGVIDPGHAHNFSFQTAATDSGSNIPFVTGNTFEYNFNIATQVSGTGISLYGARTGIGINAATTGISVNANGGNSPISVEQPSMAVYYLIKY